MNYSADLPKLELDLLLLLQQKQPAKTALSKILEYHGVSPKTKIGEIKDQYKLLAVRYGRQFGILCDTIINQFIQIDNILIDKDHGCNQLKDGSHQVFNNQMTVDDLEAHINKKKLVEKSNSITIEEFWDITDKLRENGEDATLNRAEIIEVFTKINPKNEYSLNITLSVLKDSFQKMTELYSRELLSELDKKDREEIEAAERFKIQEDEEVKSRLREKKQTLISEKKVLRSIAHPERIIQNDTVTNDQYKNANKKMLTELILAVREMKKTLIEIYTLESNYLKKHGKGGIIVTNAELELGLKDNDLDFAQLLEEFESFNPHRKSQSWLADKRYNTLFKEAFGIPPTDLSDPKSLVAMEKLRSHWIKYYKFRLRLITENQKLIHRVAEKIMRTNLSGNYSEFKKSENTTKDSISKFIGNTKVTYGEVVNSLNIDIMYSILTIDNTVSPTGAIEFPYELSTWLYSCSKELRSLINYQTNIAYIPPYVIGQINRYKTLLEQNRVNAANGLDYLKTESEIATKLEISVQRLQELKQTIQMQHSVSLDRVLTRMPSVYDGSQIKHEFASWYGFMDPALYSLQSLEGNNSHETNPWDFVQKKILEEGVQSLLDELTPKQRQVISSRFGLDDGQEYSLASVALKMDLSREQVRQLERQGMDALRKRRQRVQEFLIN